jgi:hypothetical protein
MEDHHSSPGQKTSRSLVDSESLSSVNINRNIMGCRVCRARKVSWRIFFFGFSFLSHYFMSKQFTHIKTHRSNATADQTAVAIANVFNSSVLMTTAQNRAVGVAQSLFL